MSEIKKREDLFINYYGENTAAGMVLPEVIIQHGEFLAKVVGEEVAAAAMMPVAERIAGPAKVDADWRDLIRESDSEWTEWPIGADLLEGSAYGRFGILLSFRCAELKSIAERERHVESVIDRLRVFERQMPLGDSAVVQEFKNSLAEILLLAVNRRALEKGEPVDPEAVALWKSIKVESVRNDMAGKNRKLSNVGGKIPANEALPYLQASDRFMTSVWRTQQSTTDTEPAAEMAPYRDPVFVPVARDGSAFRPGINTTGAYRVGAKGEEVTFGSFEEALDALHAMPIPYWRRPSDSGVPSIVRGISWQRFDRAYLDSLLDNPTYRPSPPVDA